MSDETMVTEREAVLREREAFNAGTRWQHAYESAARWRDRCTISCWSLNPVENNAKRKYPLPKVARPRVVADTRDGRRREFRVFGGQMQTRSPRNGEDWTCIEGGFTVCNGKGIAVDATRVALWADLLANPTEEVDGE